MHKLDKIFIIGFISIGLIGSLIDGFVWRDIEEGGFPIFTLISIIPEYIFTIIISIYSHKKYKQADDKPKFATFIALLIIPYLHIIPAVLGLIISFAIFK